MAADGFSTSPISVAFEFSVATLRATPVIVSSPPVTRASPSAAPLAKAASPAAMLIARGAGDLDHVVAGESCDRDSTWRASPKKVWSIEVTRPIRLSSPAS